MQPLILNSSSVSQWIFKVNRKDNHNQQKDHKKTSNSRKFYEVFGLINHWLRRWILRFDPQWLRFNSGRQSIWIPNPQSRTYQITSDNCPHQPGQYRNRLTTSYSIKNYNKSFTLYKHIYNFWCNDSFGLHILR